MPRSLRGDKKKKLLENLLNFDKKHGKSKDVQGRTFYKNKRPVRLF